MKKSDSKIMIEKDNVVVIFKDLTTDDDILDFLKEGENPIYDIQVTIYSQEEKIAQYKLGYEWSIGTTKFHHFVSKFVINPEYRKQFLIEGGWDGKIEYTTPVGYRINPVCKKGIEMINGIKNNKLRFKHFTNLKTGGIDGYSRLKLEQLQEIIPQNIIEQILHKDLDENLTINCLR